MKDLAKPKKETFLDSFIKFFKKRQVPLKKRIPLELRKYIDESLKGDFERYKIEVPYSNEYILSEKSNDGSNFYFNWKYSSSSNGEITITMFPNRERLLFKGVYRKIIGVTAIELLEKWIQNVNDYNAPSIYLDPIVDTFYKEQEQYFTSLDEDANQVPFETDQILKLDQYLDRRIEDIHGSELNESDKEKLIKEALKAKKDLTKSKKEALSGINRFIAVTKKMSITLGQSFFLSFLYEVIKANHLPYTKATFDAAMRVIGG